MPIGVWLVESQLLYFLLFHSGSPAFDLNRASRGSGLLPGPFVVVRIGIRLARSVPCF